MKMNIALTLLILLSILSCASAKPKIPYEKRMIIAVGDFQNQTSEKLYDDLTYNPTGNFIFELNGYGVFRIIERERLNSLLEEYKLTMTGLIDPSKGRLVGKILGVDAILYVSLSSVQYKVDEQNLNTRMIVKRTSGHRAVGISALSANEHLNVIVDSRLIFVSTGEILAASKYLGNVENNYSAITGIASSGSKMDRKEAVIKILNDSAHKLARDISVQTEENFYEDEN